MGSGAADTSRKRPPRRHHHTSRLTLFCVPLLGGPSGVSTCRVCVLEIVAAAGGATSSLCHDSKLFPVHENATPAGIKLWAKYNLGMPIHLGSTDTVQMTPFRHTTK